MIEAPSINTGSTPEICMTTHAGGTPVALGTTRSANRAFRSHWRHTLFRNLAA